MSISIMSVLENCFGLFIDIK